MTAPQDPYGRPPWGDGPPDQPPGGWPPPEPGHGAPGYGAPDYGTPGYGTPDYGTPGYGTPSYGGSAGGPGYGSPPYGTPPYPGPGFGTPAGYGGPELAGWGIRAAGYFVDLAISLAAQLVVGLVSEALSQLVGLAVFLYFGYLTGTTGQTPGRRAVGIRVVREADGQLLGAGAGIGRGFLHILDALPLMIGYLWPIWDRKKQTFADKIIGSVVIKG